MPAGAPSASDVVTPLAIASSFSVSGTPTAASVVVDLTVAASTGSPFGSSAESGPTTITATRAARKLFVPSSAVIRKG
jgi:hypothetical protein